VYFPYHPRVCRDHFNVSWPWCSSLHLLTFLNPQNCTPFFSRVTKSRCGSYWKYSGCDPESLNCKTTCRLACSIKPVDLHGSIYSHIQPAFHRKYQ
jgi:hypothetical protein